jgi:hypothetical protein
MHFTNTTPAQRLVISVRLWIEPSQSFEKNQLGLKKMFLNSLRICWIVSLLADSAALLGVLAILKKPPAKTSLAELFPMQFQFRSDKAKRSSTSRFPTAGQKSTKPNS